MREPAFDEPVAQLADDVIPLGVRHAELVRLHRVPVACFHHTRIIGLAAADGQVLAIRGC